MSLDHPTRPQRPSVSLTASVPLPPRPTPNLQLISGTVGSLRTSAHPDIHTCSEGKHSHRTLKDRTQQKAANANPQHRRERERESERIRDCDR